MHMKMCIHYFNQDTAEKAGQLLGICLCLLLCKSLLCTAWLLGFMEIKFSWILLGFLSMMIMKFYVRDV